MTLAEFLLARIAEDEAAADDRHEWDCPTNSRGGDGNGFPCECRQPARERARCEGARRIVERRPYTRDEGADNDSAFDQWEYTLQMLAEPYADHPDFDEAWTVGG